MATSIQLRRGDGRWRGLPSIPPYLPPDRWPSVAGLTFAAGDLVRVREYGRERLLVCVGEAPRFAALPDPPAPSRSWVDFWEGSPTRQPSAVEMLRRCGPVAARRVIVVACDIARRALRSAPCDDPRPAAAVEAAERFAAACEAPGGATRRARDDARAASEAAFAYAASLPRTTSREAAAADAAMAAQHAADAASSDPAEAAARCAVAAVAAIDGGRGRPDRVNAALARVVRFRIPLHVLAAALAADEPTG